MSYPDNYGSSLRLGPIVMRGAVSIEDVLERIDARGELDICEGFFPKAPRNRFQDVEGECRNLVYDVCDYEGFITVRVDYVMEGGERAFEISGIYHSPSGDHGAYVKEIWESLGN